VIATWPDDRPDDSLWTELQPLDKTMMPNAIEMYPAFLIGLSPTHD